VRPLVRVLPPGTPAVRAGPRARVADARVSLHRLLQVVDGGRQVELVVGQDVEDGVERGQGGVQRGPVPLDQVRRLVGGRVGRNQERLEVLLASGEVTQYRVQ